MVLFEAGFPLSFFCLLSEADFENARRACNYKLEIETITCKLQPTSTIQMCSRKVLILCKGLFPNSSAQIVINSQIVGFDCIQPNL
jgi:hypothetical protein